MENLFLCRECNEYGKCSAVLIDCTNFTIWLQSTKKYERLISYQYIKERINDYGKLL